MRITGRAPIRIEFGGGGTDLPSFSDRYGGCVLNATINKYAYASLKPTHSSEVKLIQTETNESLLFKDAKDLTFNGDQDLIKAVIKRMKINYGSEIAFRSEAPPDSGLGNGASASVVMAGLFNYLRYENKLNEYEIAETAYETMKYELDIQGGKQAFYSSVFGGFNFIEFLENGFTRVNKVKIKKQTIADLEKHLLLVYVGKKEKQESSQNIIKEQEIAYSRPESISTLEKLKELAQEMKERLEHNDLTAFAQKMNLAFETKKKLNPRITNQHIEDTSDLAKKNGAIAARIQGSGGGGHLLILCDWNKEHMVAKALMEKGINSIPFSFVDNGLEIWEGND
ncbi:GHMP kinase [Candidatus Woesearchaeota archaeon]|nr:GHMP kinase [Candidatus Woesearchaeota archaeon]